MNTEKIWCNVCNAAVEGAMKSGTAALLAPMLGSAAGGLIGAGSGRKGGSLQGAAVGLIAGLLLNAAVPEVQRAVCGRCGHDPSV